MGSGKRALKSFFDSIYNISMIACKFFFIVTIVITAYVVFGRYVLHSHPVWGEEVVLISITYMALISSGLALRREAHMKMTALDMVLSEKAVNRLKLISTVFVMAFSLIMIIVGFKFTWAMRLSRLTGLRIATSWQYLSVPLAGIIIFSMTLEKVLEFFGILEKTEKIQTELSVLEEVEVFEEGARI
ncbi:TRAP transporter small permease [Oceanispirochaeta sp.]|jgi:TRAP-type C4-dicarboxylate transport system permease small subunit|uniref:TRAP transporter small permease n=1 Tax=Oceanispirochaeta sp. TaxID=2035350 RepID=UPI00263A2771|nr:TRAP transporter small permease subunit [Oceanispirochaeta sp.]MDA3956246.1 TRAP transporter small permease subunit [Oceanispirochaeta sp.]